MPITDLAVRHHISKPVPLNLPPTALTSLSTASAAAVVFVDSPIVLLVGRFDEGLFLLNVFATKMRNVPENKLKKAFNVPENKLK